MPNMYCCVPLCSNNSTREKDLPYHQFPSNPIVRDQWLDVIAREGDVKGTRWLPTEYSTVCGKHFLPEDYKQTSRRFLKRTAVPSVFPGYPDYLLKRIAKMRQETQQKNEETRASIMKTDCLTKITELIRANALRTPGKSTEMVSTPSSAPLNEMDPILSSVPLTELDSTPTPDADTDSNEANAVSPATDCSNDNTYEAPTHSSNVQNNQDGVDVEGMLKVARYNKVRYLQLQKKMRGHMGNLWRKTRELKAARQKYRKLLHDHKKLLNVNGLLSVKDADTKKQVVFVLDQIKSWTMKAPRYSETTLDVCDLWLRNSPSGYKYIEKSGLFNLPSRATLKKYEEKMSHVVSPERDCVPAEVNEMEQT